MKINRFSVFFTLMISYIVSVLLIVLCYILFVNYENGLNKRNIKNKYMPLVRIVNKELILGKINKNFAKVLEESNFVLISDKKSISKIVNSKNKFIISRRNLNNKNEIIKHSRHHKKAMEIFELDNKIYIFLINENNKIIIKDNNGDLLKTNIYIFLIFIIVFICITLIYLLMLRKLYPLKILKDKVKKMADEDFDIDAECCDTSGKDEVSQLANEFKNTAKKLKNVKEARNIFIRNIMHELKTPIAKGMFLTQIEKDSNNNEKIKFVFQRLEKLINEFASIEEVITFSKKIELKKYYIVDIVDNAKDILMVDNKNIEECYEEKKLEVNYKLFSIAVKNLIDNAFKYSSNGKVRILNFNEDLIFENEGNKLKYNLEKYFEPFFSNVDKEKNSFGLGIYIIYNILKANNYTLKYEYENGINRFICKKD